MKDRWASCACVAHLVDSEVRPTAPCLSRRPELSGEVTAAQIDGEDGAAVRCSPHLESAAGIRNEGVEQPKPEVALAHATLHDGRVASTPNVPTRPADTVAALPEHDPSPAGT